MYWYVPNIVHCYFSVFLCVSYVFVLLFVFAIAASGVINEERRKLKKVVSMLPARRYHVKVERSGLDANIASVYHRQRSRAALL